MIFRLRLGFGLVLFNFLLCLFAWGIGQAQSAANPLLFWSRQHDSYTLIVVDPQRLLQLRAAPSPNLLVTSLPLTSPTGKQVVFEVFQSGNQGLYLSDRTGRALYTTDFAWQDRLPGWSPDGEKLVFWSNRTGQWHLYLMQTPFTSLQKITTQPAMIPYNNPSWSPDGESIALWFWRPGIGNSIYLLNVGSGDMRDIRNFVQTAADMAWSPDSRQIAFRSIRDYTAEISLLDIVQEATYNLSENAAIDFQPVWSPDGRQIAFVSNRGGSGNIYLMSSTGEDAHPLSPDGGWSPAWSPDGHQIAFTSRRSGLDVLYLIDTDGTHLQRIATLNQQNVFLGWYAPRP